MTGEEAIQTLAFAGCNEPECGGCRQTHEAVATLRALVAELEAARKRVVELETEKAGASARADEWEHRFDKLSALAKAERADLEQSLRLERESRTQMTAYALGLQAAVRYHATGEAFCPDCVSALAATPSDSLDQLRASIIAECVEFAQTWIDLHDPAQWCDMPREMRAALSDPPHESKETK